MGDDLEGRVRRPRGGWEREHLDDEVDDADRHDEALGRLVLVVVGPVEVEVAVAVDVDELRLLFPAEDVRLGFGGDFPAEVIVSRQHARDLWRALGVVFR
jgi:hypothetical protein